MSDTTPASDTDASSDPDVVSGGGLDGGRWVDIGSVKEVKRRRSLVVPGEHEEIAVFWQDDRACAMANICVHRDRELVRGMVFQNRVVCPGHQWAFDLDTGHCAEKERTQPVYRCRVTDDRVEVEITTPVNDLSTEPDHPSRPAGSDPA